MQTFRFITERLPGSRVHTGLQVATLTVLIAMIYGTSMFEMFRVWLTDPNASHGMLIPPLVAYLVWMRWDRVATLPANQESKGLMLTLLGCVLYLLGQLGVGF